MNHAPPAPAIHICHPESPTPLHPIRPARRLRRSVRGRDGQSRSRLILQPAGPLTATTKCYAFESVLSDKPRKGVSLLLATPLRVEMRSSSSPSSSSPPQLVQGGDPVVIKVVPQPSSATMEQVDDPVREIGALQMLMEKSGHHHPNDRHVVQLLDSLQDSDFVYLVLPYLSGGDLFARVEEAEEQGGLSEEEAKDYFRQITKGLLFMKALRISHHDLSLENVMISASGVVQIIDLGMCLHVPQSPSGVAGEPEGSATSPRVYLSPQRCYGKPSYLSPQLVREEAFDPYAADIWSLGVCLYILLTGRPLYGSPEDRSFWAMARGQVSQVVDTYEAFGLCLHPCAKELVCSMLQADPRLRPTLDEVLSHPYLQEASTTVPPSPSPEEEEESPSITTTTTTAVYIDDNAATTTTTTLPAINVQVR